MDCSEYTVTGPTRSISHTQINLTEEGLFKGLEKYLATESQLRNCSFPHYLNGKVVLERDHFAVKNYPKSLGDGRQQCRRCNKVFHLNPNEPYPKETCVYHPRSRYQKGYRFMHGCCGSDNDGCSVCDCHVYSSNVYEDLQGYVKTLPPTKQSSCHGVFSLDCEMLYTEGGMELGRVTVVDWKGRVVLDKLKKPEHPVVDYNTAYSGLTKEDMNKATLSHQEIQALVLSIINDQSILVGHSLNSDLVFLKLAHGRVVDTTLVFPNNKGSQYKHSLKFLASKYLDNSIQDSVEGHDSGEDAQACLRLMHLKVRQDVAAALRSRVN